MPSQKERKLKNAICEICGCEYYVCHKRLETQKHFACSRECSKKLKSVYMSGKGNHQFGLKGKLNSSFKNIERKIKNNYYFIRVENHPFADENGWIREHRYLAEIFLAKEEEKIEINGKYYLKPELEVHHIDENKLNNSLENLQIITKPEHKKLHILKTKIKRDNKTGRFIKSTKK